MLIVCFTTQELGSVNLIFGCRSYQYYVEMSISCVLSNKKEKVTFNTTVLSWNYYDGKHISLISTNLNSIVAKND